MSRFLEQVKNTIQRHQMLANGDKVLVGVSGGPDSIALLHILKGLQEQYQLEIMVVHVNHMFRGEEAAGEARFVAQLAQSWGLKAQVFERDVAALAKDRGLSPQDAGHQVRKGIFQRLRVKHQYTKLALGHHAADRAETLLIHLIQGTGLEGLAAMPPKKGWLIRPLAQVRKEDILNYCHYHQLPYCLDPSNNKDIYLRNKVRLRLLPYLQEEFNPNIIENLLKLETIVGEDNKYLNEQIEKLLPSLVKENLAYQKVLDLTAFNQQPLAIRRRVVRKLYSQLRPQSQGLAFNHTEQIIDLCQSKGGQKKINLPLNVLVQKGYTTLGLIDGDSEEKPTQREGARLFSYRWEMPGQIFIPELELVLRAYYTEERPRSQGKGFQRVILDGDMVPRQLEVRNRRPGDRLQPLGMAGSKKLKDLFIDKKIPLGERDGWPIIATTEEIIWLPGLTLSEKFKSLPDSKNYLVLEAEKAEYV